MESTTAGPIVLDNGESHLVIAPGAGGRLITWDFALQPGPAARLLNAPGARITAGPAILVAPGQAPEVQAGLGPAPPSALGDHFLPLATRQQDFALGTARELGTFTAAAYDAESYTPAAGQYEVALHCRGGIRGAKRDTPIILLKKLTLGRPGSEISIHYRIENPNDKPVQIQFGVEFCFALDPAAAHPEAVEQAYEFDGARERGGFGVSGVAANTTSIALIDPQPGITIRLGWERPASVWVCPAPAAAPGTEGAGACVLPVWDLRLPPEDNWAVNLWLQAGPSGPVAPLDPDLVARIARPESEDEPWKR